MEKGDLTRLEEAVLKVVEAYASVPEHKVDGVVALYERVFEVVIRMRKKYPPDLQETPHSQDRT